MATTSIARQIKALGWVSPSTSMFCVHASLPPPNTATHRLHFIFLSIGKSQVAFLAGRAKGQGNTGSLLATCARCEGVCEGVCGGGWWTPDECTSEMARARAAVVVAFMQVEKERLQYRTQGPGDP